MKGLIEELLGQGRQLELGCGAPDPLLDPLKDIRGHGPPLGLDLFQEMSFRHRNKPINFRAELCSLGLGMRRHNIMDQLIPLGTKSGHPG